MLTRQNREFPSRKTEPAFAAKAKDLQALRDAVDAAAGVSAGFWISYLFAIFYFAIAAGAVTDRDLLLENPVKLPFLNVDLPLKAFFVLGPLVFLIVHAYVLLHFVMLAGKVGAFNAELEDQIGRDDAKARLRRQLPINIFVQSLAGPGDVQTGSIGVLLYLIIVISLVIGPIALLILFQLRFLPYHSKWITLLQRAAVVIDLILLWLLWPPIARGDASGLLRLNEFKRRKVQAWFLVSFLAFLLVFTIATFPGEWIDGRLPPGWATLHKLLVAGQVNYVTGRPQSLFSNVLVVPNFEGGNRLSLRGRSLEGAVLVGAHLRNADFTGAFLKGAKFTSADLREANFGYDSLGSNLPPRIVPFPARCNEDIGCAQLQGADFNFAQLQGASFLSAQLQGADFINAQLQGANFQGAQMQGAGLNVAQLQGVRLDAALQGAVLFGAQLQGADLRSAQLQGADLRSAQLQGADLNNAQLQGADLTQSPLQLADAPLDGASLRHSYVWRTYPPSNMNGAMVSTPEPRPKYLGLNCQISECDWSEASYAALKSLIENSVPVGGQRDEALRLIAVLGKPPDPADKVSAEAWKNLAEDSAHSAGSYYDALAKTLKAIGCAADGAPYVVRGLIRPVATNTVLLDYRFEGHFAQEAKVAAAFLNEATCPGARGLSAENKAKLREIRD